MSGSPRPFHVRALLGAALLAAGCGDEPSTSPPPFTAPPAPVFDLSPQFDPFVFLPFIFDDAGANDTPSQTDLNAFTRADNVSGRLGVQWTWDDIDSWTGSGQTGDACALFDTDADGNANYAVCVRITNAADGSVVQLPADQSPQIYACSDKKTDRCSQPNPPPLPLMGTLCEVTSAAEGFEGEGEDGADVLAACDINLAAIGNATNTNLLNVCSFPSGAPNSNPFDCVVTPGAGFLQILKKTTPDASGELFLWTLDPASTEGETEFGLVDDDAGDEMTALIAVQPGTFSLTEHSLPDGWLLDTAACLRNNVATGTLGGTAITGIGVTVGETTVCTFENVVGAPGVEVVKTADPEQIPETGGDVTYTVEVTNTSVLAVTLTTLEDDRFGDLDGQGTCVTGGTIEPGDTYTCTFTGSLPPATSGSTHVNVVSATVTNAGGSDTDTDDATVTYSDVAPTIEVTKDASPTSVPETGGTVTFTVTIENTSAEPVTLTGLVDDIFGNLNGQGTCLTGGSIPAGDTYSCSFDREISGNAGTSHVNTVTATANDDDGSEVTDSDDATVTFDDVTPGITVTKTADPTSVPETGGDVTFTVAVQNDASEALTLTALTDDQFGDLDGQGTCATGGTIAAGDTYTCSFMKNLSGAAGSSHVNVATATAVDDDGSEATDFDDATVTFSDVAPAITVTKTASPTSVPETGGDVTFTVSVRNDAAEALTLTALTDDKFGDLNGEGTCATGGTIAVGGTYTCAFTKNLSGAAGSSHVNVATATAEDDDGSEATGFDDATVTFADVAPAITVTKSADPEQVPETGGDVTFTVSVQNDAAEALTLTALTDDQFGDLNGVGSCATGGTIAVGGTYTCTFTRLLAGNAGTTHTNVVTGTAVDDDDTEATDDGSADVDFTDVLPDISVTKTADPTVLEYTPGEGGLGDFTPDRTFTMDPDPPAPGEFEFASPTCDDEGANDVPAQTDLNCFNRADNVSGKLGVEWSWDDIDSWTGTGQTGDGCALLDTDNDGNANVAVCARITNSADGTQVVQVGGAGAADVYICNDRQPDRCAKQVTKLVNILTTTCTVAVGDEAFPGAGDDGADVEATCAIDLGMQGLAGITEVELLNVCSFPSGEPNSNPFDCVVRAGAGFIRIVKNVNPATEELFGFTMSPASTDGTSKYAVQGGVTTSLIPVLPGSGYSLTEVLPDNWELTGVTCMVDGEETGDFSAAQNGITDILVKTGQTTTCTFSNSGLISGDVLYTIVVTNNGLESVSLFSLIDDRFGSLDEVGTCAIGGDIAGGGSYTCTFVKTLSGAPGTSHTNVVTAVAKDDEDNSDSDTASATVTFANGST